MNNRLSTLLLVLYLIGCIVTWGHAYNSWVPEDKKHLFSDDERRNYATVFHAAFWPLYWSKEAWK